MQQRVSEALIDSTSSIKASEMSARFMKLIVALVVVALASGFRATMKMVGLASEKVENLPEE